MKTKADIIYRKMELKCCWYYSAKHYFKTGDDTDRAVITIFKKEIQLLNWILSE